MLGLGFKTLIFVGHLSWNWVWFTIRRIKHMHIQITLVSIYLHLIILELSFFTKKLCMFSMLTFFLWCSLFPQCERFHLNHLQKIMFDVNPLFPSFPIPYEPIVHVLLRIVKKRVIKCYCKILFQVPSSPWNKILS